MSRDAAEQLRRLLSLIPMLADGEAHSLEEVAGIAGTDRDTIVRDLYSLSERFGDPGGFVPGLDVQLDADRVVVRTSHFGHPMRLTVPELAALELGLAMMRRESPPDEQAVIDRARRRLRDALTRLPRMDVRADLRHAETGAAADPQHLAALRTSIRQRRRARIEYRRAEADSCTERVVNPYGMIASRGTWYLVAHCEDRGGLRIFRVDRVEKVSLSADRFDVPETFSIDAVIDRGRVFRAEEVTTLRVRYSSAIARWIAEREGVPVDSDGSVTVDHPLADAQWAVRHVLQYGADAEVLEPAAIRDEISRRLRSLLGG